MPSALIPITRGSLQTRPKNLSFDFLLVFFIDIDPTRGDVLTVDNIISIADYTSIQNQPDTSLLYTITARQQENETAIQNLLRAIEMGLLTPSIGVKSDYPRNPYVLYGSSAVEAA